MSAVVNGLPVLIPPPDGYVVDFENPKRNAVTAFYIVYSLGQLTMLAFMAQYLYVRLILQRKFNDPSTWLLVATWALSIACSTMALSWFTSGRFGIHVYELPFSELLLFLKPFTIAVSVFTVVQAAGKLCLLVYYRNLSLERWWKWSIRTVMFVTFTSSTILFLMILLSCRPIAGSWDPRITDAKCLDRFILYLLTAIIGIVTDVALLVLPMILVVRLQMRMAQKIALAAIFAIGAGTLATSILRAWFISQPSFSTPDITWVTAVPTTWA